MSSRAGSSIGTFLMSLPVSAILLMAVFGIPRFDPGTAGESGWQNARSILQPLFSGESDREPDPDPFAASGRDERAGEDRFGSRDAPRWNASDSSDRSASPADAWFPGGGERTAGELDNRRPGGLADASNLERRSGGPRATTMNSAPSISWTQARRRLADLGIDRFHLEAGLEPDQFLFVCLLSPGGDSRVTQRFEAEAVDPLAAVEQVLVQVDEWLAQRYAEESRSRLSPERR